MTEHSVVLYVAEPEEMVIVVSEPFSDFFLILIEEISLTFPNISNFSGSLNTYSTSTSSEEKPEAEIVESTIDDEETPEETEESFEIS